MSNFTEEDEGFKKYLKSKILKEKEALEKKNGKIVTLAEVRKALFLEEFKAACKEGFSRANFNASGFSLKKPAKKTKRILNLMLSDLHLGAYLKESQLPFPFGPQEEARRLAHVISNAINYKTDHREDTRLHLYILGDVIEGYLQHDFRAGAPLVTQCVAFLRHLTKALMLLSKEFPEVKVFCQTGNHGRNIARHPNRALNDKHDSYEGILYHALSLAMEVAQVKNVTFDIPERPYCVVPVFANKTMVLHGDTGPINFGNPGKTIDVAKIQTQVAKINNEPAYGGPFKLVAGGHVHIGAHVYTGGVDIVINPALIPPNGFAINFGYFSDDSGQRMWESVEEHPFGDSRLIKVGKAQDKDASLDKVIEPYIPRNKDLEFYF